MSTAQAAAATSFVAGGALAGSAAGGAFKGGASLESKSTNEQTQDSSSLNPTTSDLEETQSEVEDREDLPEDEQSSHVPATPTPKKSQEDHLKNLQTLFKESLDDVIPNSDDGDKLGYKGKIGEKYAHFLASPQTVSANYSENWWNASYEMYQDFLLTSSQELSSEFAEENVTFGFYKTDDASEKALNKVCEKLFKTAETEITEDKLVKNFWKFCSPLGSKPITIEQSSQPSTSYDEKIGSKDKDSLISVLDESNDFFWEIKAVEFLGKTNKETASFDDAFFKKYHETNKDKRWPNETISSFKEECSRAYLATPATDKSTESAPTQEVAKKYCSFVIE